MINSDSLLGQRGIIKLGCLSFLALWICLGYLSYRIVPVYLEKNAFSDGLVEIASRASIEQWPDSRIVSLVLAMAKEKDFEMREEDIQVKHVRGGPEVILIVNYQRTEIFPSDYQHVFQFKTIAPAE